MQVQGKDWYIADNASVIGSVLIEDQASILIGAGSLVPEGKTIPDGVLALGSPAKVVRDLTPAEISNLENIADGYVRRAKLYRQQLQPQQL